MDKVNEFDSGVESGHTRELSQIIKTDGSQFGAFEDTTAVPTLETDAETKPSVGQGTSAGAVHNLTVLGTRAPGQGQEPGRISVTENPRSLALVRLCPELEGQESEEKESVRDALLSEQSHHAEVKEGIADSESAGICELQNLATQKEGRLEGQNGADSWSTDPFAEECPVCTERYDPLSERRRALLNCDHTVCQQCLADMLKRAADTSRVCCPLCRQKTPLLDWEIRRMQEETVYHMGGSRLYLPTTHVLLRSSSQPATGLCAALERRLESRIGDTAMLCGCFRYPPMLVQGIRRLRHRCRCCYLTGLLLLYLAELSCLLLVFLPVIVLVLLFTLANK